MRRRIAMVDKTRSEGRSLGVAMMATCGLAAFSPTAAFAGTPKTVVDFAAPSPGYPLEGLVAGQNGIYYGVEFGTISFTGPGTPFPSVFRLAPKGPGKNGWQAALIPVVSSAPLTSAITNLTAGLEGVLYGSATLAGCNVAPGFTWPCEAVVALTPPAVGQTNWVASVLGQFPTVGPLISGLILAPSGALIGAVTDNTIFQLTPPAAGQIAWSEQTLHTLNGTTEGGFPVGRLLLDSAGDIYGAAYTGGVALCGTNGTTACGTVFRISPPATAGQSWTETTLYSGTAGLVELSFLQGGVLYGVDQAGCCGAVVKIAPGAAALPWVLTNLASFAGGADGALPLASLSVGASGMLYGTTSSGGPTNCSGINGVGQPATGCGVIFQLKPTAKGYRKSTLWSFTGGADGGGPYGGLTAGPAGELLGVTYSGGTGSLGTVYRLPIPLAPAAIQAR